METVYTPEEIADKLKVSAYTVRRWLKNGEIRSIKLRNFWRVPESALEEFLRVRTKGARKEKS
jgi:excisionase family DNA binding protein